MAGVKKVGPPGARVEGLGQVVRGGAASGEADLHPASSRSAVATLNVDKDYPILWVAAGECEKAERYGWPYQPVDREIYLATHELWHARKVGAKMDDALATANTQLAAIRFELDALRAVADEAAIVVAHGPGPGVRLAGLRNRLQDWAHPKSTPVSVPADVPSVRGDDGLQAALTRLERDAARWEACAVDLERRLAERQSAHLQEVLNLTADNERLVIKLEELRERVRVAAGLPSASDLEAAYDRRFDD